MSGLTVVQRERLITGSRLWQHPPTPLPRARCRNGWSAPNPKARNLDWDALIARPPHREPLIVPGAPPALSWPPSQMICAHGSRHLSQTCRSFAGSHPNNGTS